MSARFLVIAALPVLFAARQGEAQSTRTSGPVPKIDTAVIGTFRLTSVRGKPLADVSWDFHGSNTHFRNGELTISPGARFYEELAFEGTRETSVNTQETAFSFTSRDGVVTPGHDSVRFFPKSDRQFAMARTRDARGRTVLRRISRQGELEFTKYDARLEARAAATLIADSARAVVRFSTPPDWRTSQRPMGAGGSDRLAAWAARRGTHTGASISLNSLPPAPENIIQKKFPAFHLRDTVSDHGTYSESLGQPVLLLDLDGDGLREAIVVSNSMSVFSTDSVSLLLGIRQTATGYEIRELLRGHSFHWGETLSVERRSPTGRRTRTRAKTLWVLFQDGDCKGPGYLWTVRGGRWMRIPSDCSYGE